MKIVRLKNLSECKDETFCSINSDMKKNFGRYIIIDANPCNGGNWKNQHLCKEDTFHYHINWFEEDLSLDEAIVKVLKKLNESSESILLHSIELWSDYSGQIGLDGKTVIPFMDKDDLLNRLVDYLNTHSDDKLGNCTFKVLNKSVSFTKGAETKTFSFDFLDKVREYTKSMPSPLYERTLLLKVSGNDVTIDFVTKTISCGCETIMFKQFNEFYRNNI